MVEHLQRAPRLDLSFPLEFTLGKYTVAGHCLNLSESGLLATFTHPPDLWTTGDLVLHFGESSCHLEARVARVNGFEAGFAFFYKTEAEHVAVRSMVEFAQQRSQLVVQRPF